jgi:hypothetical protein
MAHRKVTNTRRRDMKYYVLTWSDNTATGFVTDLLNTKRISYHFRSCDNLVLMQAIIAWHSLQWLSALRRQTQNDGCANSWFKEPDSCLIRIVKSCGQKLSSEPHLLHVFRWVGGTLFACIRQQLALGLGKYILFCHRVVLRGRLTEVYMTESAVVCLKVLNKIL